MNPGAAPGAPAGEGGPGWFADLGGAAPAPGPVSAFGLAAGVLALAGLVAALALRPEAPAEADPGSSPEVVLTRRIEEALAPKAAGRYGETWAALRALHDEAPWEPAVNLELARLHEELAGSGAETLTAIDAAEARLELAAEYVELALRKRPEWQVALEAAARIALARGRVAVRAAGLAERTPPQTLAWADRAQERLAQARRVLPAESPDLPRLRRERLLGEIDREEFLARVKRARGFAARRGEGDLAAVRREAQDLLAEARAPDDVRKAAQQLLRDLELPPSFGPAVDP